MDGELRIYRSQSGDLFILVRDDKNEIIMKVTLTTPLRRSLSRTPPPQRFVSRNRPVEHWVQHSRRGVHFVDCRLKVVHVRGSRGDLPRVFVVDPKP